MRMSRIESFPPMEGRRLLVLVLGTMPGIRSLEAGEYYAHPQNAFWRIVAPWSGASDIPYRERCAALKRNGIGLWDVVATCDRKGSLDQDIRNPRPNALPALGDKHPELRLVLCNGKKAHELLTRLFELPPGLDCRVMPSTSPAYARKGKAAVWRRAMRGVLGSP